MATEEKGLLYLVSKGMGRYCGALPIELKVCPSYLTFRFQNRQSWFSIKSGGSILWYKNRPYIGTERAGDSPVSAVTKKWPPTPWNGHPCVGKLF